VLLAWNTHESMGFIYTAVSAFPQDDCISLGEGWKGNKCIAHVNYLR
jgi:hypothetical protein